MIWARKCHADLDSSDLVQILPFLEQDIWLFEAPTDGISLCYAVAV